MTEVAFHFNAPDKRSYACRLLRKAYLRGARVLVLRCLGTYIDDVLTKAETLKTEGKLADHAMREALTNFTFSCQEYLGSKPTGTPQQCARKEAILET